MVPYGMRFLHIHVISRIATSILTAFRLRVVPTCPHNSARLNAIHFAESFARAIGREQIVFSCDSTAQSVGSSRTEINR